MKMIVGFSLIEFMIALFISLFLYACCLSIYSNAQRHFRQQSALHQVQENAEMIAQLFTKNIALTGYIGCPRLTNDFPIQNNDSDGITADNKIRGFKQNDDDAITIRHMDVNTYHLKKEMSSNNILYIADDADLAADDIAMITDCSTAEVFRIKRVDAAVNHAQKVIPTKALAKQYEGDASVGKLTITTYFIAETNRFYSNKKPIRALYEQDMLHGKVVTMELMEGVQHMQIRYDIEKNNSIIEVPAEQVSDWSALIGVSISVSLLSTQQTSELQVRNIYIALRDQS